MTLREIIKKLCSDRGISVNKLETELGFAKGYVSKLDKSKPNSAKLQQIADYFNVSLDYLMTGKEPNVDYVYNEEWAEFLVDLVKSDDPERVRRIMSYYSCLGEKEKDIMEQFLKTLSENVNEK